MTNLKPYFIPLLILISVFCGYAQPICHFRHYSTDDGLPQYTIMEILQDKNGFMWFGTWDGLSKFDGYRFRNYKVKSGDNYFMKSSRIERMYDDKFGRIWFLTYDGEIHCFDAGSQKFWGIQLAKNIQKNTFHASRIEIKPSGKVWLLSEKEGCVLVKDSLFTTELFNVGNSNLRGTTVNFVLEDQEKNSWLLTNNGLKFIPFNNQKPKSYFYEIESTEEHEWQSFYSSVDLGKDIFFGSQNGCLWKYNKQSGKFQLKRTPVSSTIKKIVQIDTNHLILVSDNQGFILYNTDNDEFKLFNTSNLPTLKSNTIGESFLLNARDFWFDTKDMGIYRFDLQTLKLSFYRVATDDAATIVFPPKTMVFKDIEGRIWIQPKGGGFSIYNPTTNQLDPFFNSKTSVNWRFSNILHAAFSDNQGNLWLCTRSHGLEKVVFDKNFFRTKKINNEINSVISNDVRAVFEDDESNIWVATKDRRLTIYDKNHTFIGQLSASAKIVKNGVFSAMVYSIMQDKNRDIWIGTKGGGLYKLKRKSTGNEFEMTRFVKNTLDVYSISDNNIYSIFQDSKGRVWVGTYGGGLNLVHETLDGKTVFINHHNNLKDFPIDIANRIRFIAQNGNGNISIGTTGGLIMFSSEFNDPEDIEFKIFSRKPGNKESLSNNDVHGICISRQGEMFLATFGGGLNKVVESDKYGFPTKFKSYNGSSGLPSDITLAVIEDEFGKLWISSENNLSKFDPVKESFESFAEIKRLMSGQNFSEASTCKLRSNEFIFGYSNGIISFSPRQIINNSYRPNIVFSNLQIFNKDVEIGEENSPLISDINTITKLKLTHKQNFINIEFAALDFVDPDNILYAYKLEGFDPDWNYVQKQRIANYTNLPKGSYVFRVKSTNSEGIWVENERSMPIEVLPSFWETIWAYMLYILLFASLIYLILRILFTFYQLRANVVLEKKLSEMKLRFFTDISHEIRTPLTMITAPVDYLLNDKNTPELMKKQLKNISQNTNRMLRLVNQILDFRKIQFLHLKVQEIEFATHIESICDNFTEIAHEQHIKFKFLNKAGIEKVWIDPDCLEKIVVNLLSNAFKYTNPGKLIQVTVFSDEKHLSVEVKDEGNGMSKDKQKNLFVRFASFNEDKSKPSTGIGLSMVKDLADKHGAKINVVSEVGKGSVFTVSFLRGISHFDKNVEIITNFAVEKQTEFDGEHTNEHEERQVNEHSLNKQDNRYSVMIVEDDDDLRHFIKDIIESEYFIYEAVDGQDGLEKALKYCPDFIVSDIMMPRMDGIELLQKIKTNINTSHIPVVLLSAKTTIESKLEGLSYGADDYITKPFSVPYFQARIANLIQQRKQLQEIFRSGITQQSAMEFNPQPYTITSQDESLMKKVLTIIEENMENSEMTVVELGQNMMMSRSVFFKKIKSLTGLAPVEFIRDMKMKRAAQILSSGQYMVKEVSYLVGISDTKYFTKCFKAKYGVTPIEYKNKKNE